MFAPDFTPGTLTGWLDHGYDALIDVRSPSEFAEDHAPGAVNMPVLSDEERARVGTIYKQVSAFEARKVGGALVARNTAAHVERHMQDHGGGWRPLIYCWRGGMRSGAFATVLRAIGWRAETAEGGYKAYRAQVVGTLYEDALPAPPVLLGGLTGTAKTRVLTRLPAHGCQVIDLEGLANHRGSLFGWQGAQPSQKAFESALAAVVVRLDPARPVVIEAESSKVGERAVPVSVWKAMRAAPMVEVTAPLPARAAFTVRAYAEVAADRARLARLIDKLRPYQPGERIAAWHEMAAAGRDEALAGELMAHHYDPRYAKQAGRGAPPAARVALDELSEEALDGAAARVAAAVGEVSTQV